MHERRKLLTGRDVFRPVEKRRDLHAVERLVPDVFRVHEDLPIDGSVLGLDQRFSGVGREVVGDERRTRHVG